MSRGPQSALSFDTRDPRLTDVLKAVRRTTELDLSVSFPATVSQIIDNGELVNVIPEFKDVVYTETGTAIAESLELASMPVWTYGQGSATGAYLQFPVRVGDKGMVLVSDRSLDGWYESGMANAPSHPHTHNKIDGVFIPGLRDRSRALPQNTLFPDTAVLESAFIKLGEAASLGAARTTDNTAADITMLAWITAVSTFINGIVAGSVIPPTDFGVITGGSTKVTIE